MISFNLVDFSRASHSILSQFSLKIAPSETFVLLGRSGCGKTTILRLVNRMLEQDGGEVTVEGRSTRDWNAIQLRRRIGYVIQDAGLFPHYTVARNVGLLPVLEGWKPERTRRRVEELLNLVGLDPSRFAHRYPRELSGGQRQRVGVARALAIDPPLLLMDEPFGALDPLTRSEIQKEFKQLQQSLGKTILFVTHDLAEAFLLGDRVGLMEEGRLVICGTPAELLGSDQPQIRAFLEPFREWNRAIFQEPN